MKRGGRREMLLPEGAPQPRQTDTGLVKALARAFRWKRILESGEFATIGELAAQEGIAPSYMMGVLRLTLIGRRPSRRSWTAGRSLLMDIVYVIVDPRIRVTS